MKIIKTILCPMILIACVAPIFAQQKESLPEFYDSEIIKVSYSFWGGMTLSVKRYDFYNRMEALSHILRPAQSIYASLRALVKKYKIIAHNYAIM